MSFKRTILFSPFLAMFLASCNSQAVPDDNSTSYNQNDHTVTTGMYLIRDNLYLDETGDLFFRMLEIGSNPADIQEFEAQKLVYNKRFGTYSDDNQSKRLRDVIDAKSWRHLYDTLYIDKNNLYCHHYITSGSFITQIEEFDPKAMKALIIHTNGSWRISEISSNDVMEVTQDERVWHFTDGLKVLNNRCENQGPLDKWKFE